MRPRIVPPAHRPAGARRLSGRPIPLRADRRRLYPRSRRGDRRPAVQPLLHEPDHRWLRRRAPLPPALRAAAAPGDLGLQGTEDLDERAARGLVGGQRRDRLRRHDLRGQHGRRGVRVQPERHGALALRRRQLGVDGARLRPRRHLLLGVARP